jgi:hypothetical protein
MNDNFLTFKRRARKDSKGGQMAFNLLSESRLFNPSVARALACWREKMNETFEKEEKGKKSRL